MLEAEPCDAVVVTPSGANISHRRGPPSEKPPKIRKVSGVHLCTVEQYAKYVKNLGIENFRLSFRCCF